VRWEGSRRTLTNLMGDAMGDRSVGNTRVVWVSTLDNTPAPAGKLEGDTLTLRLVTVISVE
jgi:hypothetical protein